MIGTFDGHTLKRRLWFPNVNLNYNANTDFIVSNFNPSVIIKTNFIIQDGVNNAFYFKGSSLFTQYIPNKNKFSFTQEITSGTVVLKCIIADYY